jgi:hypothetical protein
MHAFMHAYISLLSVSSISQHMRMSECCGYETERERERERQRETSDTSRIGVFFLLLFELICDTDELA